MVFSQLLTKPWHIVDIIHLKDTGGTSKTRKSEVWIVCLIYFFHCKCIVIVLKKLSPNRKDQAKVKEKGRT